MPINTNVNLLDHVMSSLPNQRQGMTDQDQLQAMQAAKQKGVTANQLGANMLSSAAQDNLAQTQSVLKETEGVQKTQQQQQTQQVQMKENYKDLALKRYAQKNSDNLATIDSGAQQQIYVQGRKFNTDQANLKYMNQQMLDQYIAQKAVSDQQVQDYVSTKNLMMQRQAQVLGAYQASLETAITNGYLSNKQQLDQESQEALARLAAKYKQDQMDALKKAHSQSQLGGMIAGAFTIGGAIVGGALGGSVTYGLGSAEGAYMGAGAGAAIGGAAGSIFAPSLSGQTQ